MFVNFSVVNYQIQQDLRSAGISVQRTKLGEISAALLGYATYAAYHADDTSPVGVMLDDAEHIVFQPSYAETRCHDLGLSGPIVLSVLASVAEKLKDAILATHLNGPSVHSSLEDFEEDFLHPQMLDAAENSDEASSAMAETNAYIDIVEIEEFDYESSILGTDATWTATGLGAIHMDQDTEKAFSGDKVNFSIKFFFEKNGRVGLRHVDTEVAAGVDHSWYEEEDPL